MSGFYTETPTEYGDSQRGVPGDQFYASEFTAPGSGTLTLIEIGALGDASGQAGGAVIHLGVFTDDAADGSPADLVTNSDSGEITMPQNGPSIAHTYDPQPEVTAGVDYWLVSMHEDGNLDYDYYSTGATAGTLGGTYGVWPTDGEWNSLTGRAWDCAIYVVYEEAGGGRVTINANAWPLGLTHGMSFRQGMNN